MLERTFKNGELISENQNAAIPIVTIRSPLEILSDLTQEEYAVLWSAAQQSSSISRWFDMMRAAAEIRSDDPRTIAGLTAAVDAGLLTRERVITVFGVDVP